MPGGAPSSGIDSCPIVLATTAAESMGFVNPVAGELARRGHTIHLVSGDRAPDGGFAHSRAVLPMSRGISPKVDMRSLALWVDYLRNVRPRMIIAGTPKASLTSLVAARMAKVPVRVYVIHGAVWDGASGSRRCVLEGAERVTIAASTHQLAVSDSLARLIRARRLSRRIPEVLGAGSFCGVDLSRFYPPVLGDQQNLSMCFVGRLSRDKGIHRLIRILDQVRDHLNVSLTVIGGVDRSAPPDDEILESLARHPNVDLIGHVPDVGDYLRQSSLMLLPTSREGLPQAVLEAQACGVPVVSWRVTGVVDAVQDGFTGILVPFGDESAMAKAAVELLTNSKVQHRMASNAREWIEERFERSSVVAANVRYLENLVE